MYLPRLAASVSPLPLTWDLLSNSQPASIDTTTTQNMALPTFTIQPPATRYCLLSYPAPYTLLITLNRPKELNCINMAGHAELDQVFTWLDREPALRIAIITGTGRAFCAGADLKGTRS